MLTSLHPLLAEAAAFGEAMNRLEFGTACIMAVVAVCFSFFPRGGKSVRLLSIGLALVSASLVVHLWLPSVNNPMWQPVWVMTLPVLVSLVAVSVSVRVLFK